MGGHHRRSWRSGRRRWATWGVALLPWHGSHAVFLSGKRALSCGGRGHTCLGLLARRYSYFDCNPAGQEATKVEFQFKDAPMPQGDACKREKGCFWWNAENKIQAKRVGWTNEWKVEVKFPLTLNTKNSYFKVFVDNKRLTNADVCKDEITEKCRRWGENCADRFGNYKVHGSAKVYTQSADAKTCRMTCNGFHAWPAPAPAPKEISYDRSLSFVVAV